MFDLGWTEILVVGIVALIVVGPKDLPKMFRTLGQVMAKARAMAREFQRAMDDAADASGVKDMARDLKNATDPQGMGLDELNKLKSWDPMREDGKPGKPKRDEDDDDDEAALDRISEEMENLRRERASAKAGKTGGKGGTPDAAAASSATESAAPPATEPTPAESDGPQSKTP